jgi:acetyl esterase/lipase
MRSLTRIGLSAIRADPQLMNPRLFLAVTTFASLTITAVAAPSDPIPLWPAGAPGEADLKLPEESVEKKGEHQIDIRSNVTVPTLTFYPAPEPNGTAILVCPGGGYNILADSHEGTDVCAWLNKIGVSAALLRYRVPRREHLAKHGAPLQDVHRAMGILHQRAGEWKIKTERIGILGFSAGGHLAVMALTSDGTRTYPLDPAIDAADNASVVPAFAVLGYPAYLLDEKDPDKISPEIVISEKTGPAFVFAAHGDDGWVEGSARFFIEMKRHQRDCELHIFGKGGHGFGYDKTEEEIKQWSILAEKWMRAMTLIP